MSTKSFRHPPIYPGFPWKTVINIKSSQALFPIGVELKADIKANPGSPSLAILSTSNGGIRRVDDNRIEIAITAAQSTKFITPEVVLDVIQTAPEPKHLGIRLQIKTQRSVTNATT